jgi:hypothetical protein
LAATIEAQGAISEERLAEAFDRLDSDDSGYITTDNLRELLGDEIAEEEINAIIKEADLTNDNRISYPEFLALWEDKNEEKRESMIVDLRQHSASLNSDADHWISSYRQELNDDSISENQTLARANYIEGKQLSERKSCKLSHLSAKDIMQLLYTEDEVIIDSPKPGKYIESVGYENLVPAM